MLDVAWPEILVIGAVALVAIGPKDLPKVMHTMGTWAAKARRVFLAIQHDIECLGYEAEEAERKRSSDNTSKPPDKDAG